MNGNHRDGAIRKDKSTQSGWKHLLRAVCAFCVAMLLICSAAHAQDNWTNSAGGSWAVGTNWSESNPPSTDAAVFNLGSTSGYTVTLPGNTTLSTAIEVQTDNPIISLGGNTIGQIGTVTVANSSGQNGSLTVLGPGTTNVTGSFSPSPKPVMTIGGNGGTGQLTVNDAQVLLGNSVTFSAQTLAVNNGGQFIESDSVFTGTTPATSIGSLTMNDGSFESGSINGPSQPGLVIGTLAISNHSLLEPALSSPTSYTFTSATVDDSTIDNFGNLINIGTLTMTDGASVGCQGYTGQSLDIESGTLLSTTGGLMSVNGTMTVQMVNGQAEFHEATFSGTLNLTLPNDFVPTLGEQFQPFEIYSPATISSTFSTLNMPTLPSGLFWNTSALYTTGVVSVVPEPGTIGLLTTGALVILNRRRRVFHWG